MGEDFFADIVGNASFSHSCSSSGGAGQEFFSVFFCKVNGSHESRERDRPLGWFVEEEDKFFRACGTVKLNGELVPVVGMCRAVVPRSCAP